MNDFSRYQNPFLWVWRSRMWRLYNFCKVLTSLSKSKLCWKHGFPLVSRFAYSVFARSPLCLSPKLRFLARSGPPFVIRGIPIQWERSGLQMADLNERNNGVWGSERGDRANTELTRIHRNRVILSILFKRDDSMLMKYSVHLPDTSLAYCQNKKIYTVFSLLYFPVVSLVYHLYFS